MTTAEVLFVIIGAVVLSEYVASQRACQTPFNLQGECIPLRQCQSLYSLVLPNATTQQVQLLRRSRCGSNGKSPLVCCPPVIEHENQNPEDTDLFPEKCGVQTKDRIYGGHEADIGEFPWIALIHYTQPAARGRFLCGGSVINKRYVVTAAHCVMRSETTKRKDIDFVRLGEWDVTTDPDCQERDCAPPAVDVPISDIIPHENYNTAAKTNDIALIRLSHEINFHHYLQPICLPFAPPLRDKDFDGWPLMVAGFGKTENATMQQSPIKMKLALNGTNINQCKNVYQTVTVGASQLCAGGEEGKDSCSGDSGGPLMAEDANSASYLIGIVSFGIRCGEKDKPGVYTRVDQYLDWIRNNVKP